MAKPLGYKDQRCETCHQTLTVLYPVDLGTADNVKALAVAVRLKGVNSVHTRREMEVGRKEWTYQRMLTEGKVTSSMVSNWIRAHKHGLVAMIKDQPGFWCLTSKGAKFLRGGRIAKYAVQDKTTGHLKGYWEPEKYTTTIHELRRKEAPYWEGIDYDIEDGNVTALKPAPKTLFT